MTLEQDLISSTPAAAASFMKAASALVRKRDRDDHQPQHTRAKLQQQSGGYSHPTNG